MVGGIESYSCLELQGDNWGGGSRVRVKVPVKRSRDASGIRGMVSGSGPL